MYVYIYMYIYIGCFDVSLCNGFWLDFGWILVEILASGFQHWINTYFVTDVMACHGLDDNNIC